MIVGQKGNVDISLVSILMAGIKLCGESPIDSEHTGIDGFKFNSSVLVRYTHYDFYTSE